jgi:hypothetical protein
MLRKLVLALLACGAAHAVHAEDTHQYHSEVRHVEELGNLLYAEVSAKNKFKLKSLANYKEVKAYLSGAKCEGFSYKAYRIQDKELDSLYFVASKTFSNPVIIGRHFVAPIENNALNLDKFASSTRGCLNLGPVKGNVSGMFSTSLDPYPNEFHVLQSKLHDVGLYVATKYGLWGVEDGKVSLVELREDEAESEDESSDN